MFSMNKGPYLSNNKLFRTTYRYLIFFVVYLGYYHKDIGLLQTGVPECRLFGYTRDLPSMPPRALQDLSWPKSDAFVPLERSDRGKYYGYYHEAIARERQQRKKELPESMRVEARDIPML